METVSKQKRRKTDDARWEHNTLVLFWISYKLHYTILVKTRDNLRNLMFKGTGNMTLVESAIIAIEALVQSTVSDSSNTS